MKCPNCGTRQPDAPECVRCGVIIAKVGRRRPPAPERSAHSNHKTNEEQIAELKAQARQAVADARAELIGLQAAIRRAWDRRPIDGPTKATFLLETGKLLEAGLPTAECFAGLSKAAKAGRMEAVVQDMQRGCASGERLFAAMARWPAAFDDFDCKLAELGLRSGQGSAVFAELSERARARGQIARSVVGNPRHSPLLVGALMFSVMVPLPIDGIVAYTVQVFALVALLAGCGLWVFTKCVRVATDAEERAAAMARARAVKPLASVLVDRRNADLFTFLAAALRTGMEPDKALGLAGRASDDPELAAAVERAVANIDPKTWMAGAAEKLSGLGSADLRAFDPEDGNLLRSMGEHAEVARRRLVARASRLGRALHWGLAALLVAGALIGSRGVLEDSAVGPVEPESTRSGEAGDAGSGDEDLQGAGRALEERLIGAPRLDERTRKALGQ